MRKLLVGAGGDPTTYRRPINCCAFILRFPTCLTYYHPEGRATDDRLYTAATTLRTMPTAEKRKRQCVPGRVPAHVPCRTTHRGRPSQDRHLGRLFADHAPWEGSVRITVDVHPRTTHRGSPCQDHAPWDASTSLWSRSTLRHSLVV
jgi:hypothetical protein